MIKSFKTLPIYQQYHCDFYAGESCTEAVWAYVYFHPSCSMVACICMPIHSMFQYNSNNSSEGNSEPFILKASRWRWMMINRKQGATSSCCCQTSRWHVFNDKSITHRAWLFIQKMLETVKPCSQTLKQRSWRNIMEHLEGGLRNHCLSWSCHMPSSPPRESPALPPLPSSQVQGVLPKIFYKCTKCSFPGVSN